MKNVYHIPVDINNYVIKWISSQFYFLKKINCSMVNFFLNTVCWLTLHKSILTVIFKIQFQEH